MGTFICYDKSSTTFYNISCHLLKRTNIGYSEGFIDAGAVLVARLKNANSKDSLTELFETGASDDPLFSVYNKEKKSLLKAYCLWFYVNGAGIIYTIGHINNMYDCKRKFQIQQNDVVVTKYLYSGAFYNVQKVDLCHFVCVRKKE